MPRDKRYVVSKLGIVSDYSYVRSFYSIVKAHLADFVPLCHATDASDEKTSYDFVRFRSSSMVEDLKNELSYRVVKGDSLKRP